MARTSEDAEGVSRAAPHPGDALAVAWPCTPTHKPAALAPASCTGQLGLQSLVPSQTCLEGSSFRQQVSPKAAAPFPAPDFWDLPAHCAHFL